MSFILDALRKSEAARRRSEAPDLFAAMPQTTEPERSRRTWPLWAAAGIGVLSLIAAIWLVSQRPSNPASTTRISTNGTAGDDGNDIATNDIATVEPPPAAGETIVASTPADTPPVVAQPTTNTAVPQAISDAPITTPAQPAPVAPPPIATLRELPPPPPAATPAIAPPAGDQVVSIADLDPATRKQLPPLKLSMHLWNETPSGRFVILDGQRLKEGDVLGDLVVERITRDGAVLVWRGGRLKIALQ
jgi:general secretion pathway protein B